MKKLILLLTIVALATTIGCNKEEITPEPELKSGTIYCWADIWQLPDAMWNEPNKYTGTPEIIPQYYIDGLNLDGADIDKIKVTKSTGDSPDQRLRYWQLYKGVAYDFTSKFFYVVPYNGEYHLCNTPTYDRDEAISFYLSMPVNSPYRPYVQTMWIEVHLKNGDIYNGMQIKLLWEAEDNGDPYGDPLPVKRD